MTTVVPRRSIIDVGRGGWQHGGGHGTNVMFIPRDDSGQGHRHSDADSRVGSGAVPSFLSAEGTGAGGEPVLQQVPGEDPEAAQVRELTSQSLFSSSVSTSEFSFFFNVVHLTKQRINSN